MVFTAAQAAQKYQLMICLQRWAFTAAQAAQKWPTASQGSGKTFTAAQAAQKLFAAAASLRLAVHCRTGISEMVRVDALAFF